MTLAPYVFVYFSRSNVIIYQILSVTRGKPRSATPSGKRVTTRTGDNTRTSSGAPHLLHVLLDEEGQKHRSFLSFRSIACVSIVFACIPNEMIDRL